MTDNLPPRPATGSLVRIIQPATPEDDFEFELGTAVVAPAVGPNMTAVQFTDETHIRVYPTEWLRPVERVRVIDPRDQRLLGLAQVDARVESGLVLVTFEEGGMQAGFTADWLNPTDD